MAVLITFRDKNGFPYTRDAEKVLYARSRRQNCVLYFENGDVEVWGYPLSYFHQKVWDTNLFRRLDRFLLVKISKVVNRKWLKLILCNGCIIGLTRKGNNKVKNYFVKHSTIKI